MRNQEIADLLERMGTLLEIKGELIFRIRAYQKAAENIRNLSEDIEVIAKEDRLSTIAGVGKAFETKIIEYLESGKMSAYEKLIKQIPETLLEVIHIPSVGPKKAKLFFEELKIKDLKNLQMAAEKRRLLELPGIQNKTVENILKGIKIVQQGQERMNLAVATQVAEEFIAALKKLKGVENISTAGSLRRCCETIGDIDILVQSASPHEVMDQFVRFPSVKSINVSGDTKSSVLTQSNIQVDLRVVHPEEYGAALLYFTGSKDFNIKLRQMAIKRNMKINEYGVFTQEGGRQRTLAGKTEEECLRVLGLEYIPPELREEIGEKEIFFGKGIPQLIEENDIQGDLHVHSTWSDGRNTILEMAQTAQRKGYQYLAVSDHSFRLKVARGVSPENLKKKKKEIEQMNKRFKNFRILFGTEVEIDSDGELDYNNKILSQFDVVIAAIHSGFEQDSQKLTRRLLKACQNKYVHIIAHPTGIHIGKREPCDIDFKEVCKAAVDSNIFLEINAFPVRLDLNSRNVYFAKKEGVRFVINTDAHETGQLDFMKFGVSIARRGWLQRGDVLNTRALKDLEKFLKK